MKSLDLLSMAFMNLWRRKLRAFLTVLGMVIGTASIVIMVSLGIGINEAYRQNLEKAGSLTTINVMNYRMVETDQAGGGKYYNTSEVVLDNKSVAAISKIPGVKAVMPVVSAWGMVKSGKYATDLSLMGVDLDAVEEFGFKLNQGRMAKPTSGSRIEVVFGSYVLNNFYNPLNGKQAIDAQGNSKIDFERSRFEMTFDYSSIYNSGSFTMPGEEPPPRGRMYKIDAVGVLSEEGNNAYYSLIDIHALTKLAKENKDFMGIDPSKYSQIWVKCTDVDTVLEVKKQIEELGYGAESLLDQLEMVQESSNQLQMLLGAIGAVSLLVAAIGIMNTMMMSIYERTREIGIIKVLGCRMSNIAALFLTEAAYIGFFGGGIGLGVSYALSAVITRVLQSSGMMSVIPLWLSFFALAFSVVVALVSGMYPAIKAMRLSALSAIRAE